MYIIAVDWIKWGEGMDSAELAALNNLVSSDEMIGKTVEYLASCLQRFLRQHDRLLICFPDEGKGSLGNMLARASSRVGATPVFWGRDRRWKTLLRIAFTTRATAIAAPPLLVLGLSKLAKATGTPLYFRNVLITGYPCLDWMIDGIGRGFDSQVWGCFCPGTGAVVGGFSCSRSRGVHIRDDEFEIGIEGPEGEALPEGDLGHPVIIPKRQPHMRCASGLRARLDSTPCDCGQASPRLMDITAGELSNSELAKVGREVLQWTSVLDCDIRIGESGLEMELVVFPGEKLPRLPSCAKQVVRPWDGERDVPMALSSLWVK